MVEGKFSSNVPSKYCQIWNVILILIVLSLVISGEITGGDLVSYCFFAQTVTVELGSLPDLFSQWTKIGVASVKVFEIIEKQEELENKLRKQPNKRLKYIQ
jgi:ABC-type bacteriocin/lantibiotic exporter with double-glycine peptidase domain